jgi:hypothetical protein
MKYETVQNLIEEDFKRPTGVQRSTFDIIRQMIEQDLGNFGGSQTLIIADQHFCCYLYIGVNIILLNFILVLLRY